jgi:hypothetical protein
MYKEQRHYMRIRKKDTDDIIEKSGIDDENVPKVINAITPAAATIMPAYSPKDTYDDIVAGRKDIRDFDAHRGATCEECGLTARNKLELQDHMEHAHQKINKQ